MGARIPDLVIRIKKKTDGSAALTCERPGGSVTWQRQDGRLGAFFPLHDLTHYAVEAVLGLERGFWGLLADGWDLLDFGKPWPRGPLPLEALVSEFMVGFLDQERASGETWSAGDLNTQAAAYCAQRGLEFTRPVRDEELSRVRGERQSLFARWAAVPPGSTLELTFRRSGGVAPAGVGPGVSEPPS